MDLFNAAYLRTLIKAKTKQFLNRLPFFKNDSYTTFIILGHPRTGTSLLHTYLNSHWNILSLNEPLNNALGGEVLFKKPSRIIKAVGFKYFYEYTREESKRNVLIELAKGGAVKIIKIDRKNYLRTYVSRCIAEKTNAWSSTAEKQQSSVNKKVTLTKENCLHAFDTYKKDEADTDAILKAYKVAVFAIDYETLAADPTETMFAIQDFLNVYRQRPESLLKRQNAEPLHMLIENYNELKASFAGTEFQTFFEE